MTVTIRPFALNNNYNYSESKNTQSESNSNNKKSGPLNVLREFPVIENTPPTTSKSPLRKSKNFPLNRSSETDPKHNTSVQKQREDQISLNASVVAAVKKFTQWPNLNENVKLVAYNFLLYFENPQFCNKEKLQSNFIGLTSSSDPQISYPTLALLHSIKEANFEGNHDLIQMATKILEEEVKRPIGKKFFELIEKNELLKTDEINELLYALSKNECQEVKEILTEKEKLEEVNTEIIRLIESPTNITKEKIFKSLNRLIESGLWKNDEILDIALISFSATNFVKLKDNGITYNREIAGKFLTYFKSPGLYAKETKINKITLEAGMMALVNHLGPNIQKIAYNFLDSLRKIGLYKSSPISEITKLIFEKKYNSDIIKKFIVLANKSKNKNKRNRTTTEKEALIVYSFLFEENNDSLMLRFNKIVCFLDENKKKPPENSNDNKKYIMDFLGDLGPLKDLANQGESTLLAQRASAIVSLNKFLDIQIPSAPKITDQELEITNQELEEFKDYFLTQSKEFIVATEKENLAIQTSSAPKITDQKLKEFTADIKKGKTGRTDKLKTTLIKIMLSPDEEISAPIYNIFAFLSKATTSLDKSRIWNGQWMLNETADLLRVREALPFTENFLELVQNPDLIKYFSNNNKSGDTFHKIHQAVYLFIKMSAAPNAIAILSEKLNSKKEDIITAITQTLTVVINHSNKKSAKIVADYLSYISNNPDWSKQPAQLVANAVLAARTTLPSSPSLLPSQHA